MHKITLVTSPDCSYCHAAKNLLQRHNLDFQEVDLLRQRAKAQQLLLQSGRRTVPQIFINRQPIGGFTELAELIGKREMDLLK